MSWFSSIKIISIDLHAKNKHHITLFLNSSWCMRVDERVTQLQLLGFLRIAMWIIPHGAGQTSTWLNKADYPLSSVSPQARTEMSNTNNKRASLTSVLGSFHWSAHQVQGFLFKGTFFIFKWDTARLILAYDLASGIINRAVMINLVHWRYGVRYTWGVWLYIMRIDCLLSMRSANY